MLTGRCRRRCVGAGRRGHGPDVPVVKTLVHVVHDLAGIRDRVWQRASAAGGDGPVVLDIDASLVEIHSENKHGAAPHFKGGYGFHPLFCFADATGKALAGRLRPGRRRGQRCLDLLEVLDDGVQQLPVEVAAGHRPSDNPDLVGRPVVVRSDSAEPPPGSLMATVQHLTTPPRE